MSPMSEGEALLDWDTVILLAFFQCIFLDVFSMLEYLETVLPPATGAIIEAFDCWMGAFTMDPEVCQQHFESCVPVWLIWKLHSVLPDMKVLKEVGVTCLNDIIMDAEDFEVRQVLKWTGSWCYPASNAANSSGANSSMGAVRAGRHGKHTQPRMYSIHTI
ncbi:hypothetical protein EDD15DRAFT_2198077 [Pisolithus albus]|nr:hypothetical protein EDD15DRAFT_2198077 [Pisolithus albus]